MRRPLKFTFVTRQEWGAKKTKEEAILENQERVCQPLKHIGVTCCTNTPMFLTPSCEDQESCGRLLRKLQQYHVYEGQIDIPYNFLISQDGTVYEGRGWDLKPYKAGPCRSEKLQKYGIDIAYIGDWCHHIPNRATVNAFYNLMTYGVNKGYVKWQFKPIMFKGYSDFGYKEYSKSYKRVYKKRDTKLHGKGGPTFKWPLDEE